MGSAAAPLIALDAVAVDTETTGLDPRKAWIVEIAAVRMEEGRLASPSLSRRIRPPTAIPAVATAVHGIDDAALARAPDFAEVWPEVSAFIGARAVVGHAIGFDLAILKRECERAGIPWKSPPFLDTRLLAEVAAPPLADYSLDKVASWLGVATEERHSALGDAVIAARIFVALLPYLRDRGIRTFAEAQRACRRLTTEIDNRHRAGWAEPQAIPVAGNPPVSPRIDFYPYTHRVREVMTAPASFIAEGESIAVALECMSREQISSLFLHASDADERPRANETGIVTERDVLRSLAAHGAQALGMPVGRIASRPLACVPADAFGYLAIGRMKRLGVRHLGVTDAHGKVIGALSARDLLRLRAESGLLLGDEIDQGVDIYALARAWAKLTPVAASLLAEGIAIRSIAGLISQQVGAATRRAARLGEQRMREAGMGEAPCDYSVAVLGSAGREESLLAMDQDNALIFSEGAPDGPEDRWFAALASHMADILHQVGVPYCRGGVMAKNPQWRGSVTTWRRRIDDWIGGSNPQDLLSVDIFFDLRCVHGSADLADRIWHAAFDAARGDAAFAKLLVESAGSREAGLNWLGRFKTVNGRIDLKRFGLFPIVTTARTLAIRHHVVERSTLARLTGIRTLNLGAQADLDALADAQEIFLERILAQQIADIENGKAATNAVAVERLPRGTRNRLRSALGAVEHVEALTRDLLL